VRAPRLVHDFLADSARHYPDKDALVFGDRRITYASVESMSNRLASALIEHGVHPGERISIYLGNCVEAVAAIFASLKSGAVFSCIDYRTKLDTLAYILNDCGARVLISHVSQWHRGNIASLCERVPSLNLVVLAGSDDVGESSDTARREVMVVPFQRAMQGFSADRPPCPVLDVDLAAIIYTSGSTGNPKGVMCSHLNMVSACSSINQYLENAAEDIIINMLSLSFDYGLYQVLLAFQVGSTLVLERGFQYPAAVLSRIEAERVTALPGVPDIFRTLLRMDLTRWDLSSVRYVTNTAAALHARDIRRIRRALPQARLYSMYGLTECKRVSYLPPQELDRRPGSVGLPIPNTEAWVENEHGRRSRPGEVGELVVRGSHVMQGYWGLPQETASTFRPGRYPADRLLYSGDLFTKDEQGFLYFKGRRGHLIYRGGKTVYPREVEEVLYGVDGVVEACVVGVEDSGGGEAVAACIVAEDGSHLTAEQIRLHCAARLKDYMVPTVVEFLPDLPKTYNHKPDRTSLSLHLRNRN
jgi:long-chain acyl-CoA synthetase